MEGDDKIRRAKGGSKLRGVKYAINLISVNFRIRACISHLTCMSPLNSDLSAALTNHSMSRTVELNIDNEFISLHLTISDLQCERNLHLRLTPELIQTDTKMSHKCLQKATPCTTVTYEAFSTPTDLLCLDAHRYIISCFII